MAAGGMGQNPFHPGTGDLPPVLAGREALKQEFRTRLDTLRSGKCRATALQLMGPRGCGKTALLAWMEQQAGKNKIETVFLPKQVFDSLDMLVGTLRWLRGSIFSFGKRDLHMETKFEPAPGLSITAGARSGSATNGAAANVARHLNALARSRGRLLVLVDEAHDMPSEIARFWYDAFQAVAIRRPMILVIAGTPDLSMFLRRSGSNFAERFNVWRVGRLTRSESSRALIEPFGEQGRFEDQALSAILDETQGYPYFIQIWGKALWNTVAESGTACIGMQEVKAAAAVAGQERQELYGGRVREIRTGGMLAAAAEMAFEIAKHGHVNDFNLEMAANRAAAGGGDAAVIEEKLLHTGFLWEAKPGEWEYGIPSLADHVRRTAVEGCAARLGNEGAGRLAAVADRLRKQSAATSAELCSALTARAAETNDRQAESHIDALGKLGLLIPAPAGRLRAGAPILMEQVLKHLGRDPAAERAAERKAAEDMAARLLDEGRLMMRLGMNRANGMFVVAEAGFVPDISHTARRVHDFLVWNPDAGGPGELQSLAVLYDLLLPVGRVRDRWLGVRDDKVLAESECLAAQSGEKHLGLDDHIADVLRQRRPPQPESETWPEKDAAPTPSVESGDDGPSPGM